MNTLKINKMQVYIILILIYSIFFCRPVNAQYKIPFREGYSAYVSQGNFGTHSHNRGTSLQYAYDFSANTGIDVVAARAGTIIAANQQETSNGIDRETNYVWIDHGNGETTIYLHLIQNSVCAFPGEHVGQGQKIGEIGNTGASTGAHLHFEVREGSPYRFDDSEGDEVLDKIIMTRTDGSEYEYDILNVNNLLEVNDDYRQFYDLEIYNGVRQSIDFRNFDDPDVQRRHHDGSPLTEYNYYTSSNYDKSQMSINCHTGGTNITVSIHCSDFHKSIDNLRDSWNGIWHPNNRIDANTGLVNTGPDVACNNGYYGNYIYNSVNVNRDEDYIGVWNPTIPATGNYMISVYIPNSDDVSVVPVDYRIYNASIFDCPECTSVTNDDGQYISRMVNQSQHKGEFLLLGTFGLDAGKSDSLVLIHNQTISEKTAFDAARFELNNYTYFLSGTVQICNLNVANNKKFTTNVSITKISMGDITEGASLVYYVQSVMYPSATTSVRIPVSETIKGGSETITVSDEFDLPYIFAEGSSVEVGLEINNLVVQKDKLTSNSCTEPGTIGGCGKHIKSRSSTKTQHTLWVDVDKDKIGSGTGPLTYYWYRNGALYKTVENTLSIQVPFSDAGFRVVVKYNDEIIQIFEDILTVIERAFDDFDDDYYWDFPCFACWWWWFNVLWPLDPNDIQGPEGYGAERWISASKPIHYIVRFENDPDLATTAAQRIQIKYPIPENVDPYSFRLGSVGFANQIFTVPDDRISYTTRLDVTDSLNMMVDVTAGIDIVKREAFWVFQAIDPVTGRIPADPTVGFLPVNDSLYHRGEGFVNFSITAANSVQTADTVFAQAEIVFDVNEPISTNTTFNTMDSDNPVSKIVSDNIVTNDEVALTCAGEDEGSGIDCYDLYVSDNEAPFELLATGFKDSAYAYTGEEGHYYGFFSLSTDHAGNKECMKNKSDVIIGFTSSSCNAAVEPGVVVNGLTYSYYEGTWENLPLLDTMEASESGHVAGLTSIGSEMGTDFAYRFEGYIYAPVSGDYTLYRQSGTLGNITIDDELLSDDTSVICLQTGDHELVIEYYQKGITDYGWQIKGPWMEQQPIPDSIVYYINTPPTNIALSSNSVTENLPQNTHIGYLTTTDAEGGPYAYSLVADTLDNQYFTVKGDSLNTNTVFDYEDRNEYTICIRTTDDQGLNYTKVFNIHVTDVNENPSSITETEHTIPNSGHWSDHPEYWVAVYPVPAVEDNITVKYFKPGNGRIYITLRSSAGNTIKEYSFKKKGDIFNEKIDVKELLKGIYILEIRQDEETYNQVILR